VARVFALVMLAGCFIKPSPPGIDVDAPPPTPNIAFVTSMPVAPGQLGSIANADALCQMLADDAQLGGTYVAWLSTSTTNAADRLVGSQGWQRVDGRPVANTVDDLTHSRMLYPIRITEKNDDLIEGGDAALAVATGTKADGTGLAALECADYTDAGGIVVTGQADAGGTHWTAAQTTPTSPNCSMAMRLYCFGIGKQVEVGVVPESTHISFVTTALEAPINGIASFDTACASEASAVGLSGKFFAAVATTVQAVRSRFTYTGPWVRRDGVTTIRADFLGMVAPISLDARGDLADTDMVWNGAQTLVAKSVSMADDCTNWSPGTGTPTGIVGDSARSGLKSFGGNTKACSNSARVYCLQE
jgi:hypothetical protein